MNENTQASVGQILREAREAQGVSVDDVAMRLRLMHRQIAAMETDDFGSLGQPVFARGFVRNYARLLGIEPDTLLERMPGAPAEPAAVSQSQVAPPRASLTSPWLIVLLLGLLVVVAVPVALYMWLNSETDENQSKRVAAAAQVRPAPVAPTAPAAAPVDSAAAVGQPAQPEASATPAAGTGEAGAPAAQATGSQLHIEFGAESWTEVRDASRRMLHRQLNPAGSKVDVSGQPPFDVVIGNASQARLTYNGRPIDLKPFTDGTVARFTLEE